MFAVHKCRLLMYKRVNYSHCRAHATNKSLSPGSVPGLTLYLWPMYIPLNNARLISTALQKSQCDLKANAMKKMFITIVCA
jgi:hypothetical protein